MLIIAVIAYVFAMTMANLSIAYFGPIISPINAFLFIGFDLAMRDWLQIKLKFWHMAVLIVFTGFLSYSLNPAVSTIAIASSISFMFASTADWYVFSKIKGSFLRRANTSNVAGAAVDSVVFPTLAFGIFMPEIIILQFIAKVSGSALWAWGINCLQTKSKVLK